MIALIQRVSFATVYPKEKPTQKNSIGPGMVVLLGVAADDTVADMEKIAGKLAKLRIFADEANKMNLDIASVHQEILLISQFTLLADVKGGNRPSFIKAAEPQLAKDLYENLAAKLATQIQKVKTGFFGEYMIIETALDGPITIILDSKSL